MAVFELSFSENRHEDYLKYEARFIASFMNFSRHAVQFYYRVYCDKIYINLLDSILCPNWKISKKNNWKSTESLTLKHFE